MQNTIKTFRLLGITIIMTMFIMNVMALDTVPDSSVVLKLKVYLDDKPANNDIADSVFVKIVEIDSKTRNKHLEESGTFSIELDLGRHFLIYLSKEGYTTHFFEFSTFGVERGMNLMLYVDITLSQEVKNKNALSSRPSNHLKYNSREKDKYINISLGTSITFDIKGTN